MYYAIIGDIRNSRKLKDRANVQHTLINAVNHINQTYKKDIIKPMAIMQGDDFQVLLKSAKHIFDIIHDVMIYLENVDVRFGIGVGTLAFNHDNGSSDGPVWWHARDALDVLKKNKKYKMLIHIEGMKEQTKSLINQLLMNISLMHDMWTNSQKSFIYQMIKIYGLTDQFLQKEVSKNLQISTSTMSEKLKSTHYYEYIKNIKIVIETIEEG